MKIAFVLSSFPVVSETFIVNQICALIDKGHEITIFTFQKNQTTIIHKNVQTYNLMDKLVVWEPEPSSKWRRFRYFWRVIFGGGKKYHFTKIFTALNFFKYGKRALSLHFFYKIQWFLQRDHFDVIHCHFAPSGLFIARLKRDGFLNNEKLVTSFHGTDINPGKVEEYKTKYQVLFNEMDLFTYNSEYTLQIIKQVQATSQKLRLLPVGLDTAQFSKTRNQLMQGPVQIVYCGRLVPFKGPDLAVEIVRKLVDRKNDLHFTIIGTGDLWEVVKDLIDNYQLHQYVTLKGAVSQEEIIQIMDGSDIFLLPGIHDNITGRAENQGLVIQEAQAMQLPVVVSNAGGMKYGLIDGETGFVVNEKDLDGFVEKLEILIRDKELRERMGEKGREYIVEKFDSKVLCEQLISYYSE